MLVRWVHVEHEGTTRTMLELQRIRKYTGSISTCFDLLLDDTTTHCSSGEMIAEAMQGLGKLVRTFYQKAVKQAEEAKIERERVKEEQRLLAEREAKLLERKIKAAEEKEAAERKGKGKGDLKKKRK